jgi:hypothetical protein
MRKREVDLSIFMDRAIRAQMGKLGDITDKRILDLF